MKRRIGLILILCNLFLGACRQPEPQYGADYNAERQKIGLPVIPSSWRPIARQGDCRWMNPDDDTQYKQHLPVHFSKYVNYRDGTLISETDTYYGTQDFTTADGTVREYVSVTYYYSANEGAAKWDIVLLDQRLHEISLEQAEEILNGWGLPRLADSTVQP